GEGGDERDDAYRAGQVAAEPGAEREQRRGGRGIRQRLREQGVGLAAGRRPHPPVGERVRHDIVLLTYYPALRLLEAGRVASTTADDLRLGLGEVDDRGRLGAAVAR